MLVKSLKNTREEFLFYKDATQPAALPKNNYFQVFFTDFVYLPETAFPRNPFKWLLSNFYTWKNSSFQDPHCRVQSLAGIQLAPTLARFRQLQLDYYCQAPVPDGLAASIYHLASCQLSQYITKKYFSHFLCSNS